MLRYSENIIHPCRTRAAAYLCLLASIIFYTGACNAPRDNPLDPSNPNSKIGVLSGSVQTQSVPRKALADVLISFEKNIIGKTGANGSYSVEYLSLNNGWLYFEKTGYIKDSVYLDWAGAKSDKIDAFLNEIPHLDSLSIYSVVLSRFNLPAVSTIVCNAYVNDADKDIDSVFLYSSKFNFRKNLVYDANSKNYQQQFFASDLNVDNTEAVTGIDFQILVKDLAGNIFQAGKGSIKRFINSPIPPIAPNNPVDTVSSMPELTWGEINAGFPWTQLVQVYSSDLGNPVLLWERSNIPTDSLSVEVDKTLEPGNYYWVIWCIDNFSDRIRSNPASFVVK